MADISIWQKSGHFYFALTTQLALAVVGWQAQLVGQFR